MIKQMMDITVYTVAYNGYGVYLPQWLSNVANQKVKPKEAIVVLSEGHNAPEIDTFAFEGKTGIKLHIIDHPERLSMGCLRNLAIDKSSCEWILYFSADDVLLDYAIESVMECSKNSDAVALRYCMKTKAGSQILETPIPELHKMVSWEKNYCNSGYVALKKEFQGTLTKYADSDYPNFGYLFEMRYRGVRMVHSDRICATYRRDFPGKLKKRFNGDTRKAWVTISRAMSKFFKCPKHDNPLTVCDQCLGEVVALLEKGKNKEAVEMIQEIIKHGK